MASSAAPFVQVFPAAERCPTRSGQSLRGANPWPQSDERAAEKTGLTACCSGMTDPNVGSVTRLGLRLRSTISATNERCITVARSAHARSHISIDGRGARCTALVVVHTNALERPRSPAKDPARSARSSHHARTRAPRRTARRPLCALCSTTTRHRHKHMDWALKARTRARAATAITSLTTVTQHNTNTTCAELHTDTLKHACTWELSRLSMCTV